MDIEEEEERGGKKGATRTREGHSKREMVGYGLRISEVAQQNKLRYTEQVGACMGTDRHAEKGRINENTRRRTDVRIKFRIVDVLDDIEDRFEGAIPLRF